MGVDFSSKEFRAGRRRLKELLGRARMAARKDRDGVLEPKSMLGQSLTDVVEEKHLEALVVYEEGAGRWYGDLVLKGLPVGMPTIMGTPVQHPRATREEAMKDAWHILVAILKAIEERKRAPRDKPREDVRIFELHGCSFSIPGSLIDEMSKKADAFAKGLDYGPEDAIAHLERVIEEIMPGGVFDPEVFESLPNEMRLRLYAAMSLALIFGEFRYPHHTAEEDEPSSSEVNADRAKAGASPQAASETARAN